MQYSQRISSMKESATLGISQRVRELKAEGKDVIGLTLGEPDFDTPIHIREAAKQALDDGYTHYPPVAGLPELKAAIAEKLQRENGLTYSPKQIVVSNGAKQTLYNLAQALINPGDEAVLPAPFWVSYEAQLLLAGAKPVRVMTDLAQGFRITPEQLEAALTPQTKVVYLNTPSNPTGSMYEKHELAALVEVLEKYPQAYIFSDEIYEHISFGKEHVSMGTFASIFDRVVTINGFSKNFAMTGWRLGYMAAADTTLVSLCSKIQGQSTSGANAFAQKGAIVGLTGGLDTTFQMRDEFKKRRDWVYQRLQEIPGVKTILPDGAFYFYPDLEAFLGKKTPAGQTLENIDDLCMYLIDEVGLALVPGSAFGTLSHVRMSYAYATEVLEDGLNRLATGLGKLN